MLAHDMLSVALPEVAVPQKIFDFVAAELHRPEHEDVRRLLMIGRPAR